MNADRARRIAQLRAMGFSQAQIANQLGISQQTVSRYLGGLNEAAQASGNLDEFFLGLVLGGIGLALLSQIFKK